MLPSDGRVISSFIGQALRGEDMTVYGDGSQTRSFCYVDDTVEAMIRFMVTPRELVGPLNLGNPQEVSVYEVATLVRDIVGSRSAIIHQPLPQDDPKQRRPDITQARRILSWGPRVTLKMGFVRTIEYFDGILAHSRSQMLLSAD